MNERKIMRAIFKDIDNVIKAFDSAQKETGAVVDKVFLKGYNQRSKDIKSLLADIKAGYESYPETIGSVGVVSTPTKLPAGAVVVGKSKKYNQDTN